MSLATDRLRWHALLGDYPNTLALKRGEVTSPLLDLEFEDAPVPNKMFKRVVRGVEFDVAELALMTFLMAREAGVPLVLLPVVLFSRNPLSLLVTREGSGITEPADLAGRRVGVRAYTTTTAAWIRGMLAHECQVDVDAIRWVTWEESHVAGFVEPTNATRGPEGASPAAMLLSGDLDAAIVDPVPADPGVRPVVADAAGVYAGWRRRHGARAVNHMVVVRESLCASHPDAVRELYRLLVETRAAAAGSFDAASAPLGWTANRASLELAMAYAAEQRLISGPLAIETLNAGAVAIG